MLAAADNDRYTAVFSCIVFVYAVQDNGMNIQQDVRSFLAVLEARRRHEQKRRNGV